MNKSEKEIHEGTQHLQQLAEEVERERAERGHTAFDVREKPEDESPEGHNLTGDDVPQNDPVQATPNASQYERIHYQNSPSN